MKRFLVTWAQNATPVHAGFWAAAQAWARAEGGEVLVVLGRYRNPTSRWTHQQETDDWWADEVLPHAVRKRRALGRKLELFADISIQPTAVRPLSGFEVFVGHSNAVFGHPKRALECVAGSGVLPRIMATTGACTLPNYTRSKAGKKGERHHVVGGLVVEVEASGRFWVRHVTWHKKTRSFTDLATRYTAAGPEPAPRALSLTLGDLHAGTEVPEVLEATQRLAKLVQPRKLFLHDVLDFRTRNHHHRGMRDRFPHARLTVRQELEAAARALKSIHGWLADWGVEVVRSNHDEAFERWLEEHVPQHDPINAPYWHECWTALYAHREKHDEWPNLFELEARRLGVPAGVRFLRRDESRVIGGVEHGFHGDKGANGARGSTLSYARLGAKVTRGHSHTPRILDGAFDVGITGSLDQGYNSRPSTWAHAHCILHADGKRQIIFIIDGAFCAKEKAK